MTAPVRLAVAGLVHDHVWDVLPRFVAADGVVPVAVADGHAHLTARAVRDFGFAAAVAEIDDLWPHRPDAVLYYGPNSGSAAAVSACAERGVHVMIEKPLAANLGQALAIQAAAARGGIRVMCNWPNAWDARLVYALQLAADGALGAVYTLRYRAAHAGPREIGCSPEFCEWLYDTEQNGAGALMDYCCYGAALAALVLGMPTSVVGVKGRLVKEDIRVEDNALLVLQYPRAFGVAEASWTQAGHRPAGLQVLGVRAGLMIEGDRLLRIDEQYPDGVPVDVPDLPPGRRHSAEYFLSCVRDGTVPSGLLGLDVAVLAQRILEAGMLASRTGRAVDPSAL